MGIIVFVLQAYLAAMFVVVTAYFIRHYVFTLNRFFARQKISYNDILDDDAVSITVLVPMHNEEKVVAGSFEALRRCDYPRDRFEVIAINDHSTDKTRELVDSYIERAKNEPGEWPALTALHRYSGPRGKQHAINDALKIAKGEIILVFDADYVPPKGILRSLSICFTDPQVGAVMGRVVPINAGVNLLTRMQDLERSGGYQVDQQARYNLWLVPQYGGTVGGFRKDLVLALGGFKGNVIAEDTELTFRLLLNGWKVAYANRAECYEEAPETWKVRAGQIRRWSRGHNQVLFAYLWPILRTPNLGFWEKVDAVLLLCIYTLPLLWWISLIAMLFLLFLGRLSLITGLAPLVFTIVYGCIGNFAPFYELAMAAMLDGSTERVRLLPHFLYYFAFSLWYTAVGAAEAIVDRVSGRTIEWKKTERFRQG